MDVQWKKALTFRDFTLYLFSLPVMLMSSRSCRLTSISDGHETHEGMKGKDPARK